MSRKATRAVSRRILAVLACACIPVPTAPAQTHGAPASREFEVASVKPAKQGGGVEGGCHGIDSAYTPAERAEASPLGRCVITAARLSHLVNIAWKLQSTQWIKSGPDWMARGDERFNVEAEAEDPTHTTEGQLLTMLQRLIVDRFQMKFHLEPAEAPGFLLTVGKNGPKLRESKSEDSRISFAGGVLKPRPDAPVSLTARRVSIPMLTELLSGFGGHGPGVDKTGLQGFYDFSLSWDNESGPNLSTALQQQLGLRLESGKVPISYFVIDSAQRPGAN